MISINHYYYISSFSFAYAVKKKKINKNKDIYRDLLEIEVITDILHLIYENCFCDGADHHQPLPQPDCIRFCGIFFINNNSVCCQGGVSAGKGFLELTARLPARVAGLCEHQATVKDCSPDWRYR